MFIIMINTARILMNKIIIVLIVIYQKNTFLKTITLGVATILQHS